MNITRQLAENVVTASRESVSAEVRLMAQNTFLNVFGTAIGASRDPAVEVVIDFASRYGGPGTVPIPGVGIRLDSLRAATVIGLAAHLDDFDDTHLSTVIHPGASQLAAALAVGVPRGVSGQRLMTAFALGCEVQLRVGVAMSPWHYDQGWHITGTTAPIGAAVTAALLADPDPDVEVVERAITLAANMGLGHRESFGSMLKSFHPGKGAANGVFAAELARSGVSGPSDILGRDGGYFSVLSPRHEPAVLNEGFGERWELLSNTFKPYPCGIVCHPAIDAGIALSAALQPQLQAIEAVAVHCHPLVQELTGNPQPMTGLQAKFSTIHGVAAALCDGQAGLVQYTDDRVCGADLQHVRSLTRLVVETDRPRDSARVVVTLVGGQVISEDVPHARGSMGRPLTEAELNDKVTGLIEPVLPHQAGMVIAEVTKLPQAHDLAALMQAAAGIAQRPAERVRVRA